MIKYHNYNEQRGEGMGGKGWPRNKTQEKQVMHNTNNHHTLTDFQSAYQEEN